MIITLKQLQSLLPSNPNVGKWLNALNSTLPEHNINTVPRIAGFFSQTGHESNDFTVLAENLNYSEDRLNIVFKKYFANKGVSAKSFARDPEKIANYVYANRLGNGGVGSGDGWMFRGAGIIQLTGRGNFTSFGKSVNMTAEQATQYITTAKGAVEAACWFWSTNKLNRFCDNSDIVGLSKAVNGGTNGIKDRVARWNKALAVLSDKFIPIAVGAKGATVVELQQKLRISADGIFGMGTHAAVKKWQQAHKLPATGIVDEIMYKKLSL